MDQTFHPRTLLVYAILLLFISESPQIFCQYGSPQNIETFYPYALPPIVPAPNSTANQPIIVLPPPPPMPEQPLPQPMPPQLVSQTTEKSSSKAAVAKAVAATAASTLVISGLFFFLVQRYHTHHRKAKGRANSQGPNFNPNPPLVPHSEFVRLSGNVKGLLVDEDGLDVVYWRKLQGGDGKKSFSSRTFSRRKYEEKEEEKQMISSQSKRKNPDSRIQEVPLLREKPSTSYSQDLPGAENKVNQNNGIALKAVEKQNLTIKTAAAPSAPLRPTQPPPAALAAISKMQSLPPPPPPLPISAKKRPAPPPLPPKPGGLALSSKPQPLVAKGLPSDNKERGSSSEERMEGTGSGQVKLKPLHWDKINANVDHSVVWNKMDGSFKFDGDMMEALFGYVATNRKSPRQDRDSPSAKGEKSGPPSQIFLLDTRKSQNIAIVIRSLAVSRKEIFDALDQGHGLNADALGKLNRIATTKEEKSAILAFDGDVTRLADAESFLYHLLKAVPSAFDRFSAMGFRLNYDSEIHQLKESLQTLEMGCKELRTRRLFFKLLEAILKAGNRMNAGTSRGNAQAFNLTALLKLSDVKSTDGKTTLLHFVVEGVVRSEGKRCVLSQNQTLSRNNCQKNSIRNSSSESSSNEDMEKEYITLGLPVVGGLSAEFSNVKKAALIDYDAFANTCSALTGRASEIRQVVVAQCAPRGGGFAREMKSFLDRAEEEIKVMREEQTRVMEMVKRTTAYYQAGASKDKGANQLQLFVTVKDFLGMVDRVCVDITRNLQRRKNGTPTTGGSSPSNSPVVRSVKFPKLPANFMSEKSSDSDESGDDSG